MKDVNATIIIDLEGKNEEEIFRSIKYTRRKYVKQAYRAGLRYEKVKPSDKTLKKIYNMHMTTLKEGGTVTWTYEKWREFIKPAEDKLFYIKKGDKTVGCFALTVINEKLFNIESDKKGIRPFVFANEKKYNYLRTNDFMYWSSIKYSLDKGYSFIDLGGWQINAKGHLKGVNHFKKEWGGKIIYYYLDYPFLTALRRKLIRNSNFFWWLNEKVKKKIGKINKSVHDEKIRNATVRN